MMKAFLAILLLSLPSTNAPAEERTITVADLNSIKIIGELGVPIHTVCKVECKVVDMSFTNAKLDQGRLAFEIISVEDKPREPKHYMDIPSAIAQQKPRVGTTYRFWAYESIVRTGYPIEAFEKTGQPPFATIGLQIQEQLVVLKNLE